MAILIKDFIKHLQNTVYEGADVTSDDISDLFNKWSNEQKLKEYYKLQRELIANGTLHSIANGTLHSNVPVLENVKMQLQSDKNVNPIDCLKAVHYRTFTEEESSLFDGLRFSTNTLELVVTYRSSKHPYNFKVNARKMATEMAVKESDISNIILNTFIYKTASNPVSYGKTFNEWKKNGYFTRVA